MKPLQTAIKDTLNKHCFRVKQRQSSGNATSGATLGLWNLFRTAILTAFGPCEDGRAYAANSSFLRLTNKLTSAQVTKSRCAFFFSPR